VKLATLVARSLRFHWRAHLGVFLGAVLGTAILVGALAVGDSVRYSLREMALARLGSVHLALNGQSRFFRAALAGELEQELGSPVVPIVLVRGTGSAPAGDARAGRVQVVGADGRFWKLGNATDPVGEGEGVALNERLANKLEVKSGDEVVLRVEKPSLLSRDAPLSTVEDGTVALRLTVRAVVTDDRFGRFSLEANQVAPYSAFVPLSLLQRDVEQPDRANVLLFGGAGREGPGQERAAAAVLKRWQLADASLELRRGKVSGLPELRTGRIFLEPPVAAAALGAVPQAPGNGVLTYFVNELRVGARATPYSTVAAAEGLVPPGMREDEVVIHQWLADDLRARVGDSLRIRYYVVGRMRALEERTASFRIRQILPMQGRHLDPELMPDFPGVSESENCRDWKPGIPVDLDRIRDHDEQYWDRYRGTPKALITLAAGQKLWNNRFGNLTAIRYPAASRSDAELAGSLRAALDPSALGLVVQPVRDQALAAGAQSMDFGALFLGFSLFIIVAALLLMALLFALGIEQRAPEVGTLLAVGFSVRRVQRLLLGEGAALAFFAALIGAFAGLAYTRVVVLALTSVWKDAVAASALRYHAEPVTLAGGALAGFMVALATSWLVVRKQGSIPVRELLTASGGQQPAAASAGASRRKQRAGSRRWLPGLRSVLVCGVGGLAALAAGVAGDHTQAAAAFFGAGALLLLAGIGACRLLLARLERSVSSRELSVGSLGVRNAARRLSRSLTAITLLASGSFLVVAIGANRHDPRDEEAMSRPGSGTGGFRLYAESSVPLHQDLNRKEGREPFALEAEDFGAAKVVALRLREGDEASCLNLNRPQLPRLLGVQPEALRGRFTFTGATTKSDQPWELLDRADPEGAIPAIADANTAEWSLGKMLGQTIDYPDEHGKVLKLKLVGTIAASVLQGSLIISEKQFVERFPSQGGYQVFLIDAPREEASELNKTLTRALEDVGFDAIGAGDRLAAFATVENTYLTIFAVLGGLGLLLGSVGLGVVVLRNVLERRGELGVLRAVGFRQPALRWLVFSEHALLLALGLGVGVVTALVAVAPSLRSPGAEVPYGSLAVTLAAVLISGMAWTWAATSLAIRGPLMAALRVE
jgi:ABC-type antimicrobial peptide transport system permease subunit